MPTCRLDERLPDVQRRVREASWDTCIVVNDANVVLGRLGRGALSADEDTKAEAVMTPGPSTVRPSIELGAIAARLRERKLTSALVTTSDGRLVGVLLRADAERRLEQAE